MNAATWCLDKLNFVVWHFFASTFNEYLRAKIEILGFQPNYYTFTYT